MNCWRLCFLLASVGTTLGFPSFQLVKTLGNYHHDESESPTRSRSKERRRLSSPLEPLHMNLQIFQRFPMKSSTQAKDVPKKCKKMQLWYRDRSTAEEEITTQNTARVAVTRNLPNADSNSYRFVEPVARQTITAAEADAATPTVEDWNIFGSVDLALVQATCMSHATLLMVGWTTLSVALMLNDGGPCDFNTLHWNGDTQHFRSLLDWSITPWRLLEGILGTFPLVALSTSICNSNQLLFCPIHFSVTNTVLSLFGRQAKQGREVDAATEGTSSLMVLFFSILISSVSAMSEELVFRGLLPAVVVSYTHSVGLALLCQALMFGLGWVRHESSNEDNFVLSLVQSMSGVWYGTVYLLAGGDILPVLVSHLLHGCHLFVGSWTSINAQLDYTEDRNRCFSSGGLTRGEQAELDRIQREAGGALEPETLASCRRFFYAFDCDHAGSLSRADVQRAVAYACLQDAATPSEEKTGVVFDEMIRRRQIEDREAFVEHRLTLSEFLHLLFTLKSSNSSNQLA